MFLSEVALGKEHTITKDDSSLRKAPAGYDSVVARGTVEPGTRPAHMLHLCQSIQLMFSMFFCSHCVKVKVCSMVCLVKLSRLVFSDPSKDITITLEGKEIFVPQGKPKTQPKFNKSSFSQSEYLIYKESQCRLRFLLELNM